MTIKTILYIISIPIIIWTLDIINLNKIFKPNNYYKAIILYLMITMGLSYLVVNFFYDFFMYSKLI